MKRRVLLVDDEISILLTLKAVLEIGGFDVDTAASAREGKQRIKHRQYDMVITDMRMENEEAGIEVITCARTAHYRPAVALLSAFPVAEEDWQGMGADQMLVKPMQTHALLRQLEALMVAHEDKKLKKSATDSILAKTGAKKKAMKKTLKSAAEKTTGKKVAKKTAAKKSAKPAAKKAAKKAVKPVARKKAVKSPAKKIVAKRVPAKKKKTRRA